MRPALLLGVASALALAVLSGDRPAGGASRHAPRVIRISAPGPFRHDPLAALHTSPRVGGPKARGALREVLAEWLRQSSGRASPGPGDVPR
jgi:hypothetical protein